MCIFLDFVEANVERGTVTINQQIRSGRSVWGGAGHVYLSEISSGTDFSASLISLSVTLFSLEMSSSIFSSFFQRPVDVRNRVGARVLKLYLFLNDNVMKVWQRYGRCENSLRLVSLAHHRCCSIRCWSSLSPSIQQMPHNLLLKCVAVAKRMKDPEAGFVCNADFICFSTHAHT